LLIYCVSIIHVVRIFFFCYSCLLELLKSTPYKLCLLNISYVMLMPLTMSDINTPEPDFRPTMLNPRPLLGFFVNSTSKESVIFVVSAETPPFSSGTNDSSLSTTMVTFGKFNVNTMLYVSKQIMLHKAVCTSMKYHNYILPY